MKRVEIVWLDVISARGSRVVDAVRGFEVEVMRFQVVQEEDEFREGLAAFGSRDQSKETP